MLCARLATRCQLLLTASVRSVMLQEYLIITLSRHYHYLCSYLTSYSHNTVLSFVFYALYVGARRKCVEKDVASRETIKMLSNYRQGIIAIQAVTQQSIAALTNRVIAAPAAVVAPVITIPPISK